MNKVWHDKAWDEYVEWQTEDKKTLKRINKVKSLNFRLFTFLDYRKLTWAKTPELQHQENYQDRTVLLYPMSIPLLKFETLAYLYLLF